MPIISVCYQTSDDPVPTSALGRLPFQRESVEHWQPDGDLGLFAQELFDHPVVGLLFDGTRHTSSSRAYGKDVFVNGREGALQVERSFLENGAPEESAPELGRALKYHVAWDILSNAVLSESAFLSLPHMLEAETDLECSLQLANSYYYKQAAQVLRGFLEGQTIDIALARQNESYRQWREGQYHAPSIRGDRGLLKDLVRAGVLDRSLADRVGESYKKLNAYVHGAETTLIHSGLYGDQHTGHAFRADKLLIWVTQFSETVDIAIHLTKVKTRLWLNDLRDELGICSRCRENGLEQVDAFTLGGENFTRCRCRVCSNIETFDKANGQRVYVQSVESAGLIGDAAAT